MEYFWYLIFNEDEFDALGVGSFVYTYNLQDIGKKSILVTKGEIYSIVYEGVTLSPSFGDGGVFEFDGYAVRKNDETGNYFLGVPR